MTNKSDAVCLLSLRYHPRDQLAAICFLGMNLAFDPRLISETCSSLSEAPTSPHVNKYEILIVGHLSNSPTTTTEAAVAVNLFAR